MANHQVECSKWTDQNLLHTGTRENFDKQDHKTEHMCMTVAWYQPKKHLAIAIAFVRPVHLQMVN
jgi:hypothetical protein